MQRLIKSKAGLSSGLTRRWLTTTTSGGTKTTVMCFGDGSHGALGLPSSVMGLGSDAYEPTPIQGLPDNISSIAASHYHSLAVTSDGHVWSWGRNHESQLGRSPLSSRFSKYPLPPNSILFTIPVTRFDLFYATWYFSASSFLVLLEYVCFLKFSNLLFFS